MPTHAPHSSRLRRWLSLASCLSACVGTPTPEPPDNLPTPERLPFPDAGSIFASSEGTVVSVMESVELGLCSIRGKAGAVQPGSDVWLVNLDSPQVAPIDVSASASGGFETAIPARKGDRVRLVVRSETQHSLPLDGQCVGNTLRLELVEQPKPANSCLEVTPLEQTRVVADSGSETVSFSLKNRCSAQLTVDAQLRFGDQGIRLSRSPTVVPANGQAELALELAGHNDAEHAELVLLDVLSGGPLSRYVLGVWSVSASKLGND